jgi:hypothetical protein
VARQARHERLQRARSHCSGLVLRVQPVAQHQPEAQHVAGFFERCRIGAGAAQARHDEVHVCGRRVWERLTQIQAGAAAGAEALAPLRLRHGAAQKKPRWNYKSGRRTMRLMSLQLSSPALWHDAVRLRSAVRLRARFAGALAVGGARHGLRLPTPGRTPSRSLWRRLLGRFHEDESVCFLERRAAAASACAPA